MLKSADGHILCSTLVRKHDIPSSAFLGSRVLFCLPCWRELLGACIGNAIVKVSKGYPGLVSGFENWLRGLGTPMRGLMPVSASSGSNCWPIGRYGPRMQWPRRSVSGWGSWQKV